MAWSARPCHTHTRQIIICFSPLPLWPAFGHGGRGRGIGAALRLAPLVTSARTTKFRAHGLLGRTIAPGDSTENRRERKRAIARVGAKHSSPGFEMNET